MELEKEQQNLGIQENLDSLIVTKTTNNSLWRVTRKTQNTSKIKGNNNKIIIS